MKNRLLSDLQIEGRPVLGFDTGLKAQAFAQAKLAQSILQPGSIVYPEGRIETWQPLGAAEVSSRAPGNMIIWGPLFPGELMTEVLLPQERKKEAFDLFRFWLRARIVIEGQSSDGNPVYPGPAGSLIITRNNSLYPLGTVFFPPADLIKRIIDNEGYGSVINAMRYVHPDLTGDEEIAFSAGAVLYTIFCGGPPFTRNNIDVLREDIREAVFVPPELAAPGIDSELASLINRAMSPRQRKKTINTRPSAESILDFIGRPYSRQLFSWFREINEEEYNKITLDRDQFRRKKERSVKTRRFIVRNGTMLTVAMIAMISFGLITRGYIRHQADLPNTVGMTPIEVVETYYGSFGELDHMLMEACVIGRTGRGDIEMVINFFVMSRMRRSYEGPNVLTSAQVWLDAGQPEAYRNVFGVTDLSLRVLLEREDLLVVEAGYLLWLPGSYFVDLEMDIILRDDFIEPPPNSIAYRDILELTIHRDAWRISSIERME